MRKYLLRVVMGCLLAGPWFNASAAQEDADTDQVDLILGGGLILSSGYSDFIDDAYSSFYSTSGGDGWLDLYAGVEIRPAQQFGILLGVDMMINGVDASGGLLAETYANVIMVPSVYGQLYFTESRTIYINGGVNLPLPDTGSDYFEFENNGLGLGTNIGIEIAEVLRIEGGYTYIPVTVKGVGLPAEKDYDFGGMQLRLLLAF